MGLLRGDARRLDSGTFGPAAVIGGPETQRHFHGRQGAALYMSGLKEVELGQLGLGIGQCLDNPAVTLLRIQCSRDEARLHHRVDRRGTPHLRSALLQVNMTQAIACARKPEQPPMAVGLALKTVVEARKLADEVGESRHPLEVRTVRVEIHRPARELYGHPGGIKRLAELRKEWKKIAG